MDGDVLVSVGPAIAEGLLELSVLSAIRPESPAGARIECLEPAVARTVENQSSGCDQGACRGRQRLGHSPNDAPSDGIAGTELALPSRAGVRVRGGGGRANHEESRLARGARRISRQWLLDY